jgi:hypothetical protein
MPQRFSRRSFNAYFLATVLQMDDGLKTLKGTGPCQGIAKSDGVNVS